MGWMEWTERGEGEVWLTHFRALRKMTRECGRRRTGWVTGRRDMSTIRSELRDLDTGGRGGGGGLPAEKASR